MPVFLNTLLDIEQQSKPYFGNPFALVYDLGAANSFNVGYVTCQFLLIFSAIKYINNIHNIILYTCNEIRKNV